MKKKKFLIFLMLFSSVCLFFCGCTRSERVDYTELNRRLKKENAAYGFNEKEMYFNNSVYYAFYSLTSADDILLTMTCDTENKLTAVTLTASGISGLPEFGVPFTDLACALTSAFAPEHEAEELKKAVSSYKDILFTECLRKTVCGRYSVELFSDPVGISVILNRE